MVVNSTDFDAVIEGWLAQLPDWVRTATVNLSVQVCDWPSDVLAPEDGWGDDLLGLYVGTPLPEREANHVGEAADVIYLFREPHLALGLARAELETEIGRTLLHELAHYFGFDDDWLELEGFG